MALRCLLFSSDGGTAAPILQVLAGLDVEGELCSEAVTTVEKVTHQNFQIVIIDWDNQPEAGLLLTAARERKAAERPLTLAIVSNDASVPQALQAGANSILRKPVMVSQVRDTLTTARDLLRSKQESAATVAHAAAAGASASSAATTSTATIPESARERTLRAGEFLQSAGTSPGGQFETDSDVHASLHPSAVEPVDRLKDLEPMAGSVAESGLTPAAPPEPAPAPPPPGRGETRGLEWFLKTRAVKSAPTPESDPPPPAPAKLELLGFDEAPATAAAPAPPRSWDDVARAAAPKPNPPSVQSVQEERHEPKPTLKLDEKQEHKKEAELFAYISGEQDEAEESARPRFRHKRAIIGALVLASCAILAAPQAPWHPRMTGLWARGRLTVHAWLNPQLVTTQQAPAAHEDFGRAGDEYKLPVVENIPDATTDPSQIHVLPVVDPTVRKPNSLGANAVQPAGPDDPSGATPADQTPASGAQSPASTDANQPVSEPPAGGTSESPVSTASPVPAVVLPPATTAPPHSDAPAVVPQVASPGVSVPSQPAPQRNPQPQPHYATPPGNVPSSLKSQMASMTPDAGGNKAPETAMRSIEPVAVPEAEERALLTDQPVLTYPASAKGQQGTVILQVLIGRDGTVQDAKFLQGSLAFARNAIDGVKQWKFKPYVMNGRQVSVQTNLTVSFQPAP